MALEPPPTQAMTASGSLPFLFQKLLPNLPGDHRLEIPHNGGERMGAHDGAQTIVGIVNAVRPLPHGFGDRVLKGGGAGGDGVHLCPQQPHPVHIERLAAVSSSPMNTTHSMPIRAAAVAVATPCCPAPVSAMRRVLPIFLASSAWPSTLLILWAPVWFRSSRFK